jgi:MFS family permease
MTGVRTAKRSVSAFNHRNYRLFFAGQAVSLVGTWMQQVAQAWLVLELTGGDPLWLGIVSAAQFLPVVLLGLFAGVLADVLPKRQTLMAVQAVMMGLAVILAVLTLTGTVELWMVVVLALALGCANAVDMPVRQSFAMELVGPRDVGNAVALNSAMFNGARVLGPAVAGLTIGAFGVGLAFVLNALSFLAVLVALSLMRDAELHAPRLLPRPGSMGEVFENLREGLAFVRRTPVVLMAVSMVGLVATVGMNFNVLIPPLAQDVLGTDAAGYGFLMTASGIGALGAAVALVIGGRPRPVRIALGASILGAASILLALSGSYPLSLLLMVFVGGGGIAMAATANATIQLSVPDGLRGRVMSVYTTVFSASVPVGGLLMGALASIAGIPGTIAIGGILSLAVGIGGWVWWRRIAPTWTTRGARVPLTSGSPGPERSEPPSPGIAAGLPRALDAGRPPAPGGTRRPS